MIQAFWLTSPHYYIFDKSGAIISNWDELDFEWDNWFYSKDKSKVNMTVGCNNNNGQLIRHTTFDFLYYIDNEINHIRTGISTYQGENLIADRWYICYFVLDSIKKSCSFYMYSDDDNLKGTVSGVSSRYGKLEEGYLIDNYFPNMPLNVVYSIFSNEVQEADEFQVDWFYFSDKVDLTLDKIKHNIIGLKGNGIARLNTSGKETFSEYLDTSKGAIRIKGPNQVFACDSVKWIIASDYKFWAAYDVIFRYKIVSDSLNGDWINAYDREIIMKVPNFAEKIEMELIVSEYWLNYRDTVRYDIDVVKQNCSDEGNKSYKWNILGNPATDAFQLILDVYQNENYQIMISDFLGKKILEIVNRNLNIGRFSYDVNLNKFAQSFYIVSIITASGVESRKILKKR